MASYQDFNLNSGERISQYVGSPISEVQQTGNVLANRHYQNIAEMSALELALKQMQANALPGARPYIAEQVGQVSQELENMARSGAENSTAKVAALKNAFLGDEGLIHTQQRAKEYAENQALAKKITAETGREAVHKKGIFEELANAPVTIQDENGNQVLNPTYSQQFSPSISPYLDPTLDYKRITDEIKPDKWIVQGLTPEKIVQFNNAKYKLENGEIDIPKFVSEMKAAGIPKEKIIAMKNRMFEAFKNTKSYEQQKEYFGKNDEAQKEDLFNYGLLGTYTQVEKGYHQLSGLGGESGSGRNPVAMAGQVLDPAVIKEKIIPKKRWDLSSQGEYKVPDTGFGLASTYQPGYISQKPTGKELEKINEETAQTIRAAIEYYGINPNGEVGPSTPGKPTKQATEEDIQKFINSKEGEDLGKKFEEEVYKPELSNAYAATVDPKTAKVIDDFLLRNPQGLKYFNSKGEEIPMLNDKGEITDNWKELTGGDSDSFNYANTLNPKNFRAGVIGEDSAASGLHQVNAHTKDGMFSFYVSNPAEYAPERKNITVLYNKLWSKPGVYQPTPDGNQAKVLVGKQKEAAWETHKAELEKQYGTNAKKVFDSQQGLTEVKLPDGRVLLTTIESLGLQLANSGVELSFKQ